MIVAALGGGAVLAGIVGAATYDDHHNHGNYHDHSQYGDSHLVTAIKEKEAQLEAQRREVERLNRSVRDKFDEGLERIRNEGGSEILDKAGVENNYYNNPEYFKNTMIEALNNDIRIDTEQLNEIDCVIEQINQIQLSKKSEE